MKKLMIAVAIVCAAAFVQAANFNWNASGLVDESGSALTADYIGFAFYGSDTAGKVPVTALEDAIAAVMTSSFPEALMDYVGVADGGIVLMGPDSQSTVVAGSDVSAFIILTNAKYSDLDETTLAGYAPTMYSVIEGGVNGTKNIGNAGGTYTFSFGADQQGDWQSVPEPTSGLLLLLGVAGLALKRKRA